MRIYKTLIISVVVLAVGIVGFFIIREIVVRNTPSKIYELNTVITGYRSDSVEELTINNNGIIMNMKQRSETVIDSDGTRKIVEAWYLVDEENTALSQNIIDSIVIISSNLVASEIIENDAEDLAKYGLDGNYYVEGKTDDGAVYKIILGKMLYNRNGYYAMLEGDSTVYSIALYSANELYTSRAELLDLNIFKGSLNEVESFSLTKDGEHQFTIETESVITWVLTYPVESKADINNSDEMIHNLLDLAVDEFVDVTPENLADYGLEKPSYSVSITISGIEYTMMIGNENIVSNTFYAMMSNKNEVFSIDATTLTFLDNEAIDMIYAIPYLPSITNVKSVDIDIAGMELLLEIAYDPEINMLNYTFDEIPINMVLGIQTWGSFFFQTMIFVPIIELDPDWEISGEPYGRLIYTYTDDVYETIEYFPRDEESCYFVRNGFYTGLVIDKAYISEDKGLAALVELVETGKILEMMEEQDEE